jgi:diacylglycerol kinase (ATP)
MRAVLILNPASGSSSLAPQVVAPEESEATILAALRKYGIEPEVWYTTPEDAGMASAKRAVAEDAAMVIAAGGDGTLHAVAAGLIGTPCKLAIIPMGTMNNIARSLEIPETIEGACAVIAAGHTGQIDVGTINGQIFLEVAGIGLEAALFPAAEDIKARGWLSTLRGIMVGLSTLLAFQPTRFKIAFDERRKRSYRAIQVSVCNSPYYGARLRFAPRAVMNDGLLDILLYKNFSKSEYVRHAISISQGKRTFEPKVTRRKARSLYIETEVPIEIHADGIPMGYTPAMITVLPGALRVCVPESVAKGPNVMEAGRRARLYWRVSKKIIARQHQEEEGPLYV